MNSLAHPWREILFPFYASTSIRRFIGIAKLFRRNGAKHASYPDEALRRETSNFAVPVG